MKKKIIVFTISLCVGALIGSFASGGLMKYSYEQRYNQQSEEIKETEGTSELEAMIDKYLAEYGGTGSVDYSDFFENYPEHMKNWPDFGDNEDMSGLFKDYPDISWTDLHGNEDVSGLFEATEKEINY